MTRPPALLIPSLMLLAACKSLPENSSSKSPVPVAGAPTATFGVPVPDSFQLANGLKVWVLPTRQVPLVSLSLVVRSGSSRDPAGKEGLAALTADMLDEGSGDRSALEVADEVEYLGADLAVDLQKEQLEVSLETLKRNLDPALDLFADVALRPRFEAKEWARVKPLALNDIAQRHEEARDVARVVSERTFYGPGHPFSHPTDGYEATVKTLNIEDVKNFYAAHVRPENAMILATGDVSMEDLRPRLESRFGSWKGEGVAPPSPARTPEPAGHVGARLIIVDKPNAPQTEFRILLPGPAHGEPRIAPLSLANTILGGTFTSRLVTNLREKHGFTYGASSMLQVRSLAGHVVQGSAIATPKTGLALVEFWREITAMETGKFEADELQKSRSTHKSRLVEALETQDSTLKLFLQSAAMRSGPTERKEYFERLEKTTDAEVSRESAAVYRWDAATIVLVGDRKTIVEQIAKIEKTLPPSANGKSWHIPRPEFLGRDGEPLPE